EVGWSCTNGGPWEAKRCHSPSLIRIESLIQCCKSFWAMPDQRFGGAAMPVGRCPSQQYLLAFQLGDLPEPTLHDVAEHLETCTHCEKLRGQLANASDAILSAWRRQPLEGHGSHVLTTSAPPSRERPTTTEGNFSFLSPPVQPDEIGRLENYRVLRLLGKG